jgi:hypothetical protein
VEVEEEEGAEGEEAEEGEEDGSDMTFPEKSHSFSDLGDDGMGKTCVMFDGFDGPE